MTIKVYVREHSGKIGASVTYGLLRGVACAHAGGDLRMMNYLVHEILVAHNVTPNDGERFLRALLERFKECHASWYGAPTAIKAA